MRWAGYEREGKFVEYSGRKFVGNRVQYLEYYTWVKT